MHCVVSLSYDRDGEQRFDLTQITCNACNAIKRFKTENKHVDGLSTFR